ncbi:MAG: YlmC/YmxH family sporulation protein [Oscillospiraceae bacterium]|jgi:YlmC/YmxH family sporulation protein|nr:YlmC/YmxH family sporulation protein [Oscillospiraceae bacterium]
MQCRIEDLRRREVINICDGMRMGYVDDVLIDISCGRVAAVVVPGPCRFFGLFGRGDDFIIPWESIVRIGSDLILVEVKGEHRRMKRAGCFRM